jgi:uncharacterized RDD family membrane protein YckC
MHQEVVMATVPSKGLRIRRWNEDDDDGDFIDPFTDEGLFDGIRSKRVLAYLIDIFIIAAAVIALWVVGSFAVVLTFGLAKPLLLLASALLPLAYHTLTIGGRRHATFGMRALDLRVVCWNGNNPDYFQAALQTVLFYFSLSVTSVLILLVSLFNDRGRCLHDYLSGCVVINDAGLISLPK